MRSRWPIPVVALAALFCSSRLGFAYSAQFGASEREQKILRIQQLIQEHDLEKVHLELAEAAKEFPTDEQRTGAQTLSSQCADYAGLGNRKDADDAAIRLMAAADFSEPDAQQALLGLLPGKRDDIIVSLLESLQSHQQLGPALR